MKTSETTTSMFQEYPDFFNSIEECNSFNKNYNRKNTNNRYKNFNQIHFTTGDEDQFNKYRYQKNSIENIVNVPNNNLFYNKKIFNEWVKNKNLNIDSVSNTFKYIFYKFKKGIFVKIIDNKLKVFLPFSNANFTNEWSENIKIDPKYKDLYEFFEYISKLDNRPFNKKCINRFINSWYSNNCLVRYEYPINETDTNISSIKNMLEELCDKREIPNIEFFINKRDFPIITKNGFEPYYHLWGSYEHNLLSHNYDKYSPILSTCGNEHFADILMPSYEDWIRVQNNDNKWFPKSRLFYNTTFDIKWEDKKNIAVFRGSSTGEGNTIDTNQRLKISYLSYLNKLDEDNLPFLDAGITRWNFRPKKIINKPYLQTINPSEFLFKLVKFLTLEEQSQYKYIIHIDGNVSANRISYELGMNSVILIVESKWKYWFSELLIPYTHYIPIKADLSDVFEKIIWCKKNDDECKNISNNAKIFYEKYLQKDGILDYFQKLLINIKNHTGTYFYNELNILDLQNEEKINIINKSMNFPISNKNINNIFIPKLERCHGFLKSIHYIINNLNSKKQFEKNINYISNILKNKSSLIDKYNFFNYEIVIKNTNDISKSLEHIHESFIGVNCINKILEHIPNFVYHFGFFKNKNGVNIISEFISIQTLQQYIMSDKFNFKSFLNIILQICLALEFAQDNCNFIHYDLTPWNIVLKFLESPVDIDYIIKNKIIRVTTSIIPVIIDYGKSHVIFKNKHYGFNHMYSFDKSFDIITLLITTVYQISISNNLKNNELKKFFIFTNFISNTTFYKNTFKSIKQIINFFHFAKKYSNLINTPRYELEKYTPLDFFNYIIDNTDYNFNIKYLNEYCSSMNKYDPNQLYNFIIYDDLKETLNSFLNEFNKIKDFRFDNIKDTLYKLYIIQNLEIKLNNLYETFVIFLKKNNININSCKKYYNDAFKILKQYYDNINFKNIFNKDISPLQQFNNIIIESYNEDILIDIEKIKLLLNNYIDIELKFNIEDILDLTVYNNIFKKILFYKGTFNIKNKIYFLDTYSSVFDIENKNILNKISNIITFKEHIKNIYEQNFDNMKKIYNNNDIEKNIYIKNYYNKVFELLKLLK